MLEKLCKKQIENIPYERKAAYPPPELTRRLALINVFGFRRRNWRFDVLGAAMYVTNFGILFTMHNSLVSSLE